MPSVAHYRENMPRLRCVPKTMNWYCRSMRTLSVTSGRLSFSAGARY